MRTRTLSTALVTAAAVAATTMTAVPATASSGDVVKRGGCTGSTHWKLKVGRENGRLETEGQIDSNRNGRAWYWSIYHNGSMSFHGSRITRAPSGSFEVRRLLVNLKGTDTVTFRARNGRSGEFCRGTVHY